MYGKRKYGRQDKSIEQSIDNSVPTFICSRCKKIYNQSGMIELTWNKGNQ